MGYGVRLKVWGDYACFTRPEMKAERVSYDVITLRPPGILRAIHWKPAIRWVIERIHVLNPIRFDNIRRNEVSGKISAEMVKRAMEEKPLSWASRPPGAAAEGYPAPPGRGLCD